MNEWKTYRLGEITSYISRGITPSYCDTGLTIINQKCIRNGVVDFSQVKYTDPQKKIPSDKILQDRDILINSTGTGTLGRVSIYHQIGQQCTVDSHVTIVRSSKDIDATFLGYNLINQQYNIESLATGSTGQTELPRARLASEIEILLPPLDEQRRIAGILGSLDDKIELNRRINANLEAQAQALFRSWFVDFEPFRDGPFVDSELGKIPQGWKVGTASEFYKNITIGKTPPRKEHQWFSKNSHDIVWVSIADMGNCGLSICNSSEYLTPEAIKKFNICIVPINTVLLSFKLTIGRVAIADKELATNEAIAHFQTQHNTLEYTYLALKNYEFSSLGSTSSIATAVNSKIIKSMPWMMPSNDVLNQFHNVLSPIFNGIRNNIQEITRLSALRDTLLPKLMAGEIAIE